MAELRNCPTCGDFFNYTGVRDVCAKCAMNEEKMYETVYRFLRKRENRAANIDRIVEATGVTESLLHRWVRKGRLQPALFPNLGYPCDKCGSLTTTGKLCVKCTDEIKRELNTIEAAEELREAMKEQDRATYYSQKDRK
ncbi:TIGR03826 family flagellar region protein [Mammaliicoccus sciuri]|uniref:Flagellar operon protein TIGR03826 n=1 Tax=Sporosarcina newyorkensis TaxID=759851 RepID=A0A1T4Y1V9_9BACL|nr:TIGR03826 family flagellar region protein [Sporosarcina newyorkensis]SKA95613.1 flagellar operon protein TIGR03826 [Sporosarcina newyorkensis]